MNGKIKRIFGLAAAGFVAAALALLAGCSLPGDSIRDVIDDFTAAVNSVDLEGMKDTWDSDADDYNTAATTSWLNTHFGSRPYEITDFSSSGDTATVIFEGTAGGPLPYFFEMTEEEGTLFEGGTFKIRRIRQNNSSGSPIFE